MSLRQKLQEMPITRQAKPKGIKGFGAFRLSLSFQPVFPLTMPCSSVTLLLHLTEKVSFASFTTVSPMYFFRKYFRLCGP